jgi:hypothetical protein
MIFFRFIDFRDRREVNEFENEYAILMRLNQNDNEERRWFNQKKKFFVINEDLDSQMNLDESEDERSVDKWMKKIFYIISWISHSFEIDSNSNLFFRQSIRFDSYELD